MESAMAGLREEKKRDRRKRIAEAARSLFEKRGFEATSMEKIAGKAGLGVGTLYNYYPSKADLLLGIIAGRADPYERDLKKVIEKPPERLADAVALCVDSYLASFSFYSKRIWHDFAVTALARGLPLFDMIGAVDAQFLSLLMQLVEKYRAGGALAGRLSAEAAVRNLYSVLLHSIMVYLSKEDMELADLKDRLVEGIESLFAEDKGDIE
jgi:AcrR family transcriptional regulator